MYLEAMSLRSRLHGVVLVTVFCTIAIICSTSVVQGQDVVDGGVIKVLSFNIYHGETMAGDYDLDVIARVINDADPDLVALQEVDYGTERANRMNLVNELGCRTGLMSLFARAMPYQGGEYGEGILSRWSFLETRNVGLPCLPGNEPRAAAVVMTVLPSGDTIMFAGTHLAHEAEADRVLQANTLVSLFDENSMPMILAGDLNAEPGSAPMQILGNIWTATYHPEHVAFTYPSDAPEKKIDYIMYFPQDRWKVLEKKVICDVVASDHCAYLVTLQLLPD